MTGSQPFQYKPYEQGVLGTLSVKWELELITPLMIRATHPSATMQSMPKKKGRGTHVEIAWENADEKRKEKINGHEKYSQLTDFNYSFEVQNHQVVPTYHVPASSIRGTLRNAAIKFLVEMDDRRAFSLKIKDSQTMEEVKAQIIKAHDILREQRDGWHDILTLFGSAFDPLPGETPPLTWAGRMRLDTAVHPSSTSSTIDCVDTPVSTYPGTIRGHVMVRNPIDRVSMASREGGLHFSLEMSQGEKFGINMRILNPCAGDIRMLNIWREDISEGYIRFGGLTSQGRGRVKIVKENYQLYVSRSSSMYPIFEAMKKPDLAKDTLMEGIWRGMAFMTITELNKLDINLLKQTEGE
ncbi:MAG: hypothetical protein JXA79_11230 [Deltaproteobacteria bacterium]|nr:hypothetical protein [Deltaproteobacteria bacterium]